MEKCSILELLFPALLTYHSYSGICVQILPLNFIGLDTISFSAQIKCEYGFLISLGIDTKYLKKNIMYHLIRAKRGRIIIHLKLHTLQSYVSSNSRDMSHCLSRRLIRLHNDEKTNCNDNNILNNKRNTLSINTFLESDIARRCKLENLNFANITQRSCTNYAPHREVQYPGFFFCMSTRK